MLSVVLAFILGVATSANSQHKISIIDILTNTQNTQKSYTQLDQAQIVADAQQQYKSSGMAPDESPISESTMLHIASECKTPSIHKKVEDHVFMALFETINDGCSQVQGIWGNIPTVTNEDQLNELVNNVSYAIHNKTFNESVNYGIPEDVIQTITTWLEDGLEAFHPDLPYDISYHIYRWLLQRKFDDNDYFTNKCDFVNNDPVDIFTNIESTLSPVHDCMTRELVHHNIDAPDLKLNCSKVNRWNKNFVLAIEFQIQLSFIGGVNAGIGIGVELKQIAGGEFYWKAGGGLSLFVGFNIGLDVPFVAQLGYLNGPTIKLGGGIAIGIVIEAHVLLNEKFEYIGYEGDIGVGIGEVININIEWIERKSIKSFMVNLTAICDSKTFRPSGHPTFRPNGHPTLRPNNHPTHKPVKVPTRNPAHPTPGPNHPTFRPPDRKEKEHADKHGDKYHSHGSHERRGSSSHGHSAHARSSGSSSHERDEGKHHDGHHHHGHHHGHRSGSGSHSGSRSGSHSRDRDVSGHSHDGRHHGSGSQSGSHSRDGGI